MRGGPPRVYLDWRLVDWVVDEPGFAPGINALALTCDYAHEPQYAKLMTAVAALAGHPHKPRRANAQTSSIGLHRPLGDLQGLRQQLAHRLSQIKVTLRQRP